MKRRKGMQDKVVNLHKKGFDCHEIADKLDCGPEYVRKALVRTGNWTNAVKADGYKRLGKAAQKAGMTIKDIEEWGLANEIGKDRTLSVNGGLHSVRSA